MQVISKHTRTLYWLLAIGMFPFGSLLAQGLNCDDVIREPFLVRTAYEEGRFQEIADLGIRCHFNNYSSEEENLDQASNIRTVLRYLILSHQQLGERALAIEYMNVFLSRFPQYEFNSEVDAYELVLLASEFEIMKKREWGVQFGYHRSFGVKSDTYISRFDLGPDSEKIVGPNLVGAGDFSIGFQRVRSFSPRHQVGMEIDYNQNGYKIRATSAGFSSNVAESALGDWKQEYLETVHTLEFPIYYRHRVELGKKKRLSTVPGYFRTPRHWLVGTVGLIAGIRLHANGEMDAFAWESDDQGELELRKSVFSISPMTQRRALFQGGILAGLGYEMESANVTVGGGWNLRLGTTNLREPGTRNDEETEILIWNHHVSESDFLLHKWMDLSFWVRFPLQNPKRGYQVIRAEQ